MYRHILVGLDGRRGDRTILDHVAELARAHGSRVTLIRVGEAHPWDAIVGEGEKIEAYLAQARDDLAQRGIAADTVTAHGDPADTILEQAEALECDLIAMSTHGHRWLADLLFGSVAEAVRHRAKMPVLLLRGE